MNELAMGILIAATSLLALSGVFLVYAHTILDKLGAKKDSKNRLLQRLRDMWMSANWGLSLSILAGVSAIACPILWLNDPSSVCAEKGSIVSFIFQFTFFVLTLLTTGLLFRRK